MAQATGPLFSLDARGSLAKAIVFGKNKSKNTIRAHRTPQNKRTLKQFYSRGRMQLLNVMWHMATQADKDSWQDLASQATVSTYTAFLTYNLNILQQNGQPTCNRSTAKLDPVSSLGSFTTVATNESVQMYFETSNPNPTPDLLVVALNIGDGTQDPGSWNTIIGAMPYGHNYSPDTGFQELNFTHIPPLAPELAESQDYWAWANILTPYGTPPDDIIWQDFPSNFHLPATT